MIDTKEKLAAYITVLLKDYPEHGQMFQKLLLTDWSKLPPLFNVFEIVYPDGSSEWIIEYGSGWANATYPYEELLHALDCMIDKWGLCDTLKNLVKSKKKKLTGHIKGQRKKKSNK